MFDCACNDTSSNSDSVFYANDTFKLLTKRECFTTLTLI